MYGVLTLRFNTQAQLDVKRMTSELSDLQRQVASGNNANDLRGLGEAASRLLNTESLRASASSRSAAVSQLGARFGVQAAALSQGADSSNKLAEAIRNAISTDDGRGLSTELDLSFASAVSALNETWNGQPMFAGERVGEFPIKIDSIAQLMAASGPDDIYNEAERHQTIDIGSAAPIALADKASEISQGMFDTFKMLKSLLDSAGGELGAPMTTDQREQLIAIAKQLDVAATTFNTSEGRAGQLQARFAAEEGRLQDRSNLLLKEIGQVADADLALISIQISSLLVQYEASAKTYGELSKLSLLQYL